MTESWEVTSFVLPTTPESPTMTTIRTEVSLPWRVRPHPVSMRFFEVLGELGALHMLKGADYGQDHDPFSNVRASEEWGIEGWVGAMVRATDKLRRLQKVATGGTLANEGVEDSFRDLAVYAVIGLLLWEQDHNDAAAWPPQGDELPG